MLEHAGNTVTTETCRHFEPLKDKKTKDKRIRGGRGEALTETVDYQDGLGNFELTKTVVSQEGGDDVAFFLFCIVLSL